MPRTAEDARVLFQPDRHEPLGAGTWDEAGARAAISEIVEDAEPCFDAALWWPAHPLDVERPVGPEPSGVPDLYIGAAGVVWALARLERAGFVSLARDYGAGLPAMVESASRRLARWMPEQPAAYLLGDLGVRLVQWRLDASGHGAQRLLDWLERTPRAPTQEVMWGRPGVALTLSFLLEQRDDERGRKLLAREVDDVLSHWRPSAHTSIELWEQDLYGSRARYTDSVHGAAGNVHALLRALGVLGDRRHDDVARRGARMVRALACVEGDEANWHTRVPPRADRDFLLHYCHGAPGFVVCLDPIAPGSDPELDTLLLRAGSLTWRAGPLRKGPSLCHGTAGNGYAFLKLWQRTGDPVWLERARAFAVHAIEQVRLARRTHGRGRYTLWTGDLGVAIYLTACIEGSARFPTVDEF